MKKMLISLCLLGVCFQIRAQGYIVPNGVTFDPNSVFGPEFHVIQNPTTLDFTGFDLTYQGGNSFRPSIFTDEGVRIFAVSPNDPVTAQAISSGTYPEWLSGKSYTLPNGSPFYIGLYTGYGYTGTYTDPVFGWAKVVNINGSLQLLGSGLEYGGAGIYVGTQNIIDTAVPEPGTYALFLVGLVGVFGSRKLLKVTTRN